MKIIIIQELEYTKNYIYSKLDKKCVLAYTLEFKNGLLITVMDLLIIHNHILLIHFRFKIILFD